MKRCPSSLQRVAIEGGCPAFIGTTRTLRLPDFLPAVLRFLRLAVPPLRRGFAPKVAADAPPPGLGCLLSRPPAVPLSAGGEIRISQVPAQTRCRPAHAPTTPDRPAGTRLDAPADAATAQGTTVALSMDFRGSIAWLGSLLSTLQSAGSPRREARLASHLRGYALVGGVRTRWVCCERFQLCVSRHIAFSSYSAVSKRLLDLLPLVLAPHGATGGCGSTFTSVWLIVPGI